MKELFLYTDGGCEPNPGAGGWCAIVVYTTDNNKRLIYQSSGGLKKTTNNFMEIEAVYNGFKQLEAIREKVKEPYRLILVSDSQYVVNTIGCWKKGRASGKVGWIHNWRNNDWKKKDGKTPHHVEKWKEVYELASKQHELICRWVRGHTGDEFNERCDEVATQERLKHVRRISNS